MSYLPVTSLRQGDIVAFYGARFEIVSTRASQSHIRGSEAYASIDDFVGPCEVAVPIGRWLSGKIQPGYFGPDRDWIFQGNHYAEVFVENR